MDWYKTFNFFLHLNAHTHIYYICYIKRDYIYVYYGERHIYGDMFVCAILYSMNSFVCLDSNVVWTQAFTVARQVL
jgi:hypothetical protein